MAPPKLCDISEIRPYLFLSGFGCVTEKKLSERGINFVINATNIPRIRQIENVEYLDIPVDDNAIANISSYFEQSTEFIKNAKQKGGKTLVYCAAGVSRSATICIIYLVMDEGLTLREAYHDVVQRRPFISPNIGFWRQMIEFEEKLRGKSSVNLLRGMRRPVPDVYLVKPAPNEELKDSFSIGFST
ncbi:unnamed protein product [Dracunculus medinensis]|uniref:Dual specificity protein phosphatase 14 n=1 Tax=Dracunculus medinensis TaxID=318479 RepID=A0A0N4UMY3_DRAME|nr:unnamed protein product [Dracunculus medinensis]